ncbi:MAG: hypothetical protein KatS3mg115_0427 [Candidatus Poribacteria bacterium]|nr:MAG: hypothetical protein KatS3mg115_0427 [Candidatus Poribacteria bacterium]
MIRISGQQMSVKTSRLQAEWEQGVLVGLWDHTGRRWIEANPETVAPLYLVFLRGETVPLGREIGDSVQLYAWNEHEAEIRIHSWHGDGIVRVAEEPESGGIVIEASGYSSRPGLRGCRWPLVGVDPSVRLVAPFFQGVRLPLDDPLLHQSRWHWPFQWEAGFCALDGGTSGLLILDPDDHFRYKSLTVGVPGHAHALGLETEAYGPVHQNLAAGGVRWRIEPYSGEWTAAADRYRELWAERHRTALEGRPEWLNQLRLAFCWLPTNVEILQAIQEQRIDPQTVLIHLPNWRTDPYDENYPTFRPSEEGRAFIREAQRRGFRVMPHFNAIDMDPTHPTYPLFRDFQYRDIETGRVQGWTWVPGRSLPVPESNRSRLLHRDKKVMVKIHPGLAMWRSVLKEETARAVEELGLEAVFVDVTLCAWNTANALVENQTPAEGMARLIAELSRIGRGLLVGGEGRNEVTARHHGVTQAHLFRSWQTNLPELARLVEDGLIPLNERIFGRWCRSIGYSKLSGSTEEERIRIRAHAVQGAIPTLTVYSPEAIRSPNPTVAEVLATARGG